MIKVKNSIQEGEVRSLLFLNIEIEFLSHLNFTDGVQWFKT